MSFSNLCWELDVIGLNIHDVLMFFFFERATGGTSEATDGSTVDGKSRMPISARIDTSYAWIGTDVSIGTDRYAGTDDGAGARQVTCTEVGRDYRR